MSVLEGLNRGLATTWARHSCRGEDKPAVRGMQGGKVDFPKEGSENPTQAWIQ